MNNAVKRKSVDTLKSWKDQIRSNDSSRRSLELSPGIRIALRMNFAHLHMVEYSANLLISLCDVVLNKATAL